MKKKSAKSNLILLLLIFIIIFYFIFLYMDIFNKQFFVSSNILKFLSIILVLFISLLIGKDSISIKDRFLLQTGIFITLIADVFLLVLGSYYIIGIALFSVVQIIYSIRYDSKNTNRIIKKSIILFLALSTIYIFINNFILEIEFILILSFYYSICLLSSTSKAVNLYTNSPSINNKIIALAMILFLLCDMNVATYNLLHSSSLPSNFTVALKNISFISIWLFYLPSQVLLALSGYKGSYLKKLFQK